MAQNLSALIVDPNLDSRLDTSHVLKSVGLDVAGEAAYGTEAAYMMTERQPSIILLALEDPPVRGLATLEALQQQSPDMPVLVYSSVPTPQLMRQAMRAGARDFLGKPLNAGELRDAVHSVLAQEEQRQLARWSEQPELQARGTVITVAGAKGGIGKTTLATNLAIALHDLTGQEVALVDGDAQFGDVAVMLDLAAERSIADLARNEPDISRHSIRSYLTRHSSGIDVLPAASEPDDWRALQPEHVGAIAAALAETHEYVVFDTPGTMNELVAASLNEAGIVMLVTSLDVSSIKDTKTALRILESWAMPRERIRLIVNDSNRAQAVTADDVVEATGVEVSQLIQHDTNVGISVQTGIPIVSSDQGSRYSRAVMSIAERLAGIADDRARGRLSLIRLPLARRRA